VRYGDSSQRAAFHVTPVGGSDEAEAERHSTTARASRTCSRSDGSPTPLSTSLRALSRGSKLRASNEVLRADNEALRAAKVGLQAETTALRDRVGRLESELNKDSTSFGINTPSRVSAMSPGPFTRSRGTYLSGLTLYLRIPTL